MLRLWLSTDRKANSRRLLKEMAAKAARGMGGQFLVVPEQFSHMTERALCAVGGDSISRYAEVLGFSRLASRVFAAEGGSAEEQLDAGGKLLLMSLAVEQVRSRLKIYGSCVDKPEFLLQLLDTFDEFCSFCVTPAALRKASAALSGVLAQKLEEFALLMESYQAACANSGRNGETCLNRLLAALEVGDFASGKHFYFDGFTDFNGVQLEIIAQMLHAGAEVTVCLTADGLHGTGQQFETARETAAALLRLWPEQQVEVFCGHGEASSLSFLRGQLFAGGGQPFAAEDGGVRWFTAGDTEQQCRLVAGEILRLVQEGARWRDVAVACCEEHLRPVLRSVFAQAEIPIYDTGDRDILREPVVHMLLTALEAATGSMQTEDVLAYLKSGFAPLTQEECDRLENYALLWRVRGRRWEQPWTMNPYGFRRERDEAAEALLEALNTARARAMGPLSALRRGLRQAGSTGEMLLCLDRFMEAIELNARLNALAEACFEGGDLQRTQEYTQIYGILCNVMEQMYAIAGQTVRSGEQFAALFRTVLSQYQVGTIPARLDAVTVGDLMALRRSDVPVLFLMGANEGSFPSAGGRTTLLTDRERSSLMALGIGVAPTAVGRLDRELAVIDGVLAAPSRRLYLTALMGQEAWLFRRAGAFFPGGQMVADEGQWLRRSARAYRSYLAAVRGALPAALAADPQVHRLRAARDYACGDLSGEAVQRLYGRQLRLSSTKIDQLASCRFAYFLEYGLKAKAQETAELDASLYGTFVHYVLEHTARQVMAEGGFARVPRERVLQYAQQHIDRYVEQSLGELMEEERWAYLLRRTFADVRLVVEDLCQELSLSSFAPRWFELHFAGRGDLPAVSVTGERGCAELEGYVDRVDLWRCGDLAYVRVVDYKTGKKDFDYTLVSNGIGLQMLLYLFTLVRNGETLGEGTLHPAGVLYFPARVERVSMANRLDAQEMEKKRRSGKRRRGLLLDDERVLQAMEPCQGKPLYLPYDLDRAGERRGDLADTAQLRLLERHVFRAVAALSDGVFAGRIAPDPYYKDETHNACAWCDYRDVCGARGQWRRLKKVSGPKEFWERLEEAEHG